MSRYTSLSHPNLQICHNLTLLQSPCDCKQKAYVHEFAQMYKYVDV